MDRDPHEDLEAKIRELKALEAQRDEFRAEDALKNVKFLPGQKRALAYLRDPSISIVLFTGANQIGKTFLLCCHVLAEFIGYEPWSGRPRKFRPPVRIAALLTDFDNAGWIVFEKMSELVLPKDLKIIQRTQSHAPRIIQHLPTGSQLHIFTHDQAVEKKRGGTWHGLVVDEPCPQADYVELRRGVQRTQGKVLFTLTPLSEPWLHDELYDQAVNHGGQKKHVAAVTATPDENKVSQGGCIEDRAVEEFWADCPPEELEARKYGRFMHLIGRVYPTFDESVHVLGEDHVDPESCTWGLAVDPHDRLPFAMLWYYVTPGNDIVFRHEWPGGEFNKMRDCRLTVDDYIDIISQYPRTTFRQMDPNSGRRKSPHSGFTMAELFQSKGYFFNTQIVDDLAAGHKRVQERLHYDKDRELGPGNQPHLYVHRSCVNTVRSFRNYVWDDYKGKTGEGKSPKQKPREDYKHFMDCVRYVCMDQYVRYVQFDESHSIRRPVETMPGYRYGSLSSAGLIGNAMSRARNMK